MTGKKNEKKVVVSGKIEKGVKLAFQYDEDWLRSQEERRVFGSSEMERFTQCKNESTISNLSGR